MHLQPHYKIIPTGEQRLVSLFQKMTEGEKYSFLFESAEDTGESGRYSYFGYDPMELFIFPVGGERNPLLILKDYVENISYEVSKGLPNLQCGLVGYFSYELVRHFEKITLPDADFSVPEGIFFLPKNIVIFDHLEQVVIFVSYSEYDLNALLDRYESVKDNELVLKDSQTKFSVEEMLSEDAFRNVVAIAQEKIRAGDIFQVVLSREFRAKTDLEPIALYAKLRISNPSPYLFYLHFPEFCIVGSSPETLVKLEKNEIVVRPIAGTRPRGKNVFEDAVLEKELKADIKEVAEHMMLVDLGRNDVGKVSVGGSVHVTKLMEVVKYSHVMHLVSEVRGLRSADKSMFDIFASAFPAGTLTGAPKIRAMEIITKLEHVQRGVYGGAVGYFDLSGDMDFAIAIRTMVYRDGAISVRAGAGIVYDSSPQKEAEECRHKANGPLTILSR